MTDKQFLFSIVSTFCSCELNKQAEFEIINHTNTRLDSINISASNHLNNDYISILPNQSKTYFLDLSAIKVDGHYIFDCKEINKLFQPIEFGYFSNGIQIEDKTIIYIEKDTILIEPIIND